MNEKRTGKAGGSPNTDWNALRGRTEAEISAGIASDPDAVPTDPGFWRNADVVLPEPKAPITIRLDADLLRWLRREKGYQTRINAILRAYMQAHEDEPLA